MVAKKKKTKTKAHDPSKPYKNQRYNNFLDDVLNGMSQRKAYRKHYPNCKASDANVDTAASRLMTKLKPRHEFLLQRDADKLQSKRIATKEEYAEHLTAVMRASLADFMECSPDTGVDIVFDKDNPVHRALKKIKTKKVTDEHGNLIWETMFTELEMKDSLKAGEALAKLMGWNETVQVEVGLKSLMDFMDSLDGQGDVLPRDE